MTINLYSSIALEPWDWTTPWTTGIGGSETSHIEITERLGRKYGGLVRSYAPIRDSVSCKSCGPALVPWFNINQARPEDEQGIWLVYRDQTFFNRDLRPDSRYWFIAQDCDYAWTPEQLAKVHRYICLCQDHVDFTNAKYPELNGRVFLSTNGVRSSYIERNFEPSGLDSWCALDNASRGERKDELIRKPWRLFYASSPDRGLLLILRHWFRIRERVLNAELRVAYGFNNIEAMLNMGYAETDRMAQTYEIKSLLNQPGVTWLGRLNQHDVYREFFRAGLWYYPTDWPETSCISCMEAQACGAIPVTNAYWALKQNILNGVLIDGIPQEDPVCRTMMIRELCSLMLNPARQQEIREPMMRDALDSFDWQKIVNKQLVPWIKEDLEVMNARL